MARTKCKFLPVVANKNYDMLHIIYIPEPENYETLWSKMDEKESAAFYEDVL